MDTGTKNFVVFGNLCGRAALIPLSSSLLVISFASISKNLFFSFCSAYSKPVTRRSLKCIFLSNMLAASAFPIHLLIVVARVRKK